MRLLSTEIVRRYELEFDRLETLALAALGLAPPDVHVFRFYTTLPEIVQTARLAREQGLLHQTKDQGYSELCLQIYETCHAFHMAHRDDLGAFPNTIEIER